jgi:hypothetical protein
VHGNPVTKGRFPARWSVVDSFFSIGAVFIVVLILIVIVAVQQVQQNAQYREIQDRLREIRHAEMLEQQALALRAERSAIFDPLTVLEASLQSPPKRAITQDELLQVDQARSRVKAINEALVANRQWMGAPYDLDWHEFLERIPNIRSAYLAANFVEQSPPIDAIVHEALPNTSTSYSGTPKSMDS